MSKQYVCGEQVWFDRLKAPAWRVSLGLVLALGGQSLQAQTALPWTPSALARHHLQWLVDEAGLRLPTSHWPLPAAAVADALGQLPAALPDPLAQARQQVQRELQDSGRGQAELRLRTPAEALPGFGDAAEPGSAATVLSPALGDRRLAFRLGAGVARQGDRGAKASLEGSAVVAEAGGVVWQAGSRRHWWGPGWQNSLVLGHNAPALTGLGLQRAAALPSTSPWLSWLGPWNAELFVAGVQGMSAPARPYLIGTRLTLQPWPWLELALSRTAQWGGQGRDESLGSLVDALTGRGTNAAAGQEARDPANQLAGLDLRLRCPVGLRCAGTLQLMGEDQAGHLPSRYLGLYGLETWSADGRHRWFTELAETGCRMPVGQPGLHGCAYRNHAYPEGYAHGGRWLGAGVGPDARLLSLGWLDAGRQRSLRLHYGKVDARIGQFSPAAQQRRHAGRLLGLAAQQSLRWGRIELTPSLAWTRVVAADAEHSALQLGLSLRLPLEQDPS